MQIIQAIVLGLIQGLTEFIPVSSSGHLLFVEKLFHWNTSSVAFDVALHWGTLLALIAYFWKDWLNIFASFCGRIFKGKAYGDPNERSGSGRFLVPIVVASIPAAIVGLKFNCEIEAMRDRPWILPGIAGVLVVIGIVMLLAERVGKKQRQMGSMNYADYVIIGLAQALALFPGVSRSGITISTGMFRKIDRAAAARFSFLLSTPVILGAGLKKLKDTMETGLPAGQTMIFAVGFAAAAISGYLAIRFLMNHLQRGSLMAFAVYRFVLAAAMLVVFVLTR